LVDEDTRVVKILLVYSKNEISPPNETQKWKAVIKSEYGEIANIFNL
jgi:ribosome biogenesis GTPase A